MNSGAENQRRRGYEPGGRRFESCRARQLPFGNWLLPAVFRHAASHRLARRERARVLPYGHATTVFSRIAARLRLAANGDESCRARHLTVGDPNATAVSIVVRRTLVEELKSRIPLTIGLLRSKPVSGMMCVVGVCGAFSLWGPSLGQAQRGWFPGSTLYLVVR
jgi:hypothetical protein